MIAISARTLTKAVLFFISTSSVVNAQSLQVLEAKIKSMEACRQSLTHTDCNLQILEKSTRDSLVALDKINKTRQQSQPEISKRISSKEQVQFFTGTISEVSEDILKIMGGSIWKLDRNYFGLPLQDVIGVVVSPKSAVIYANDNSYNARLISGSVKTSSGVLSAVTEKMGGGAILKLTDGTLLEFANYDQFNTGWWLPPYDVLIDGSGMNLWNLQNGKKVWIQRVH